MKYSICIQSVHSGPEINGRSRLKDLQAQQHGHENVLDFIKMASYRRIIFDGGAADGPKTF